MHFLRRRRPRRRAEQRDPRTVRALLDFGAGGARALIARLTPDGAEILGTAEVTGRSGMARPGQVMRREQLASLAERSLSAAEWATARDGELPFIADDAIVGLTGPLLTAYREVCRMVRSNPIAPIYQEEILESLEAAQRRSLALLGEQVGRLKIRRTLVGSQLVGAVSVRGDTGEVERLLDMGRGVPGFSGDYLAIALCNLTWPTKGLEILARVMEDLELNLLDTLPIAQAVAAALPRPDAILIDIGHEHTELSLAEGGALSHLKSIPLGGQFFTQSLTRNLRLSEKHAELVKRQRYAQGRSLPERSPVFRILKQATQVWYEAVEPILARLAGDAPLPPRLYLFGGGAQLPEILDHLRGQSWMQRLPFDRHPTVERLLPHHLQGVQDPRGLLRSPAQVGLAALAAWAGREPLPLQRYLDQVTTRLAPGLVLA